MNKYLFLSPQICETKSGPVSEACGTTSTAQRTQVHLQNPSVWFFYTIYCERIMKLHFSRIQTHIFPISLYSFLFGCGGHPHPTNPAIHSETVSGSLNCILGTKKKTLPPFLSIVVMRLRSCCVFCSIASETLPLAP